MNIDLNELSAFIEKGYQESVAYSLENEEYRRALAVTESMGEVAQALFADKHFNTTETRSYLEGTLKQHFIAFCGLLSYYDFDLQEMVNSVGDIINKQLTEVPLDDNA
jgi:hypothetical protein